MGLKPKQSFTKDCREIMSLYGSNQYSSRGKFWDRNMKQSRQILEEKENQMDIFLPASQLREAEGDLRLRSCLHDAIINLALSIGKFINKHD